MILRKKSNKDISSFLFFLILTGLIFVFDRSGLLASSKRRIMNLISPFLKQSHQISYYTVEPFSFLSGCFEKKDNLSKLEKDRQQLQSLKSQLVELRQENNFLRRALNLSTKKHQKFLIAQVIGRIPEPDSGLLINLGSKQGLQQNDVAILPGYFLVGKITHTFSEISQVMILTNPHFSITVRGQESRVDASLSGNQNQLKIEMTNYQDQPKIGETFITSGLDNLAPSGLIVGKLSRIVAKPTALIKIGWLTPAINFSKLERVLILKTTNSS